MADPVYLGWWVSDSDSSESKSEWDPEEVLEVLVSLSTCMKHIYMFNACYDLKRDVVWMAMFPSLHWFPNPSWWAG